MSTKIAVLGAGSFGTAMAHLLQKNGHIVTLWARDGILVDEICRNQTNSRYFPDFRLSNLSATDDITTAVIDAEFVLFAIPCQHLRQFLIQNRSCLQKSKASFVNLAKGLEMDTFKRPSEIFADELGAEVLNRYSILSGPTFARELIEEQPSGAVVASASQENAKYVQKNLSLFFFRLYTAKDLIGVELGGAIKNVMAICTGVIEGLGYGLNARAGLITRCLHEMTELGVACGARERTFSGLSGIGDLILTCTGDLSRNRQVGLRLGRGERIQDIVSSMNQIAEGITTARSIYFLNQKLKVEIPNAEHVYKVLYENMAAKDAVRSILSRELKAEYADD